MLKGINKKLTGEMLKVLCDMGHGDVLIIADANFPAESISKNTTYGKVIRCSGIDGDELLKAIVDLFPLDVDYSEFPACVMERTDSDIVKGMPTPIMWNNYIETLNGYYPSLDLGRIERMEFYERAKKAYVVIQTGEERQYGNLLLIKGCVL